MMRRLLAPAILLLFLGAARVASAGVVNADTLRKAPADSLLLPQLSVQQLQFKGRLDSIRKTVPLTYNEHVQKYIDMYLQRGSQIARMLGLSQYYFPIFNKSLKAFDIPEEIKFISVVESSLNPFAVSRTGAAGPWQFTTNTARGYGLAMDNFVDERRDPVAASMAAAHYFKDAFNELGDWLLAIAAYNCGKGAVSRAIQKAGVADYWAIRKYLPVETQNYVPAFIATAYMMSCNTSHNIAPADAEFRDITESFPVTTHVALTDISQATGVDVKLISLLNPAYKKMIVNGSVSQPKILLLPVTGSGTFTALYEVLNQSGVKMASVRSSGGDSKQAPKFLSYKVKPGDTLSVIAGKFEGATTSSIKASNNLKHSALKPGMVLKIGRL